MTSPGGDERRHTARQDLAFQGDLFRLLVESVEEYAIFVLDPSGHVATWNTGAERINGYRASEIIGKHFSIFYPADVAAAGKCEFELGVAAKADHFEEEGLRVRKDGSTLWASVTITALRDPQGKLVGFAKVTRDLTERRKAEEEKRELAAQVATLAEKSRTQDFQERFLGILGHDLRNPLASMEMGAGLLRQRITDPTALRILERMDTSARRMSRMIEQILDLTRNRLGGGVTVRPRSMDLGEALVGIVEELRTAHPSRAIDLRCSAIPGRWDPDRLEQVFSNLIGNALIHGDPSEPVRIDLRAGDDVVSVEIRNDGPPIPEELRVRLFDPFRRGERDSRTPKTAGLGLGLYISNEIVVAHGGRIEVSSDAGDGTVFRVILPRFADHGMGESTEEKEMTHTVLVLEDEEDLREMMREALELNGYSVVTAREGQQALDAITQIEHICLVLLDLFMPGMNGWDFFAELRRRPEFADVPVVVHSSSPERAPAGVTRSMGKPIVLTRLLSVVEEFCEKS